MKKPIGFVSLSLLLFLAAAPLVVFAQTTATLAGRVVDATGAALPGVRITTRRIDTGVERATTTTADGRFAIAGLPAAEYEVRAELSGFRPLVRAGLRLTVGENAAVILTLQVGATEVVTVTGDASPVNTRSGELSYLVDQRTIERIPLNGRNYTDLMALQPGVTPFPNRDNGSVVAHGLAMSVNGQDTRANVYLLDGTLLNDFTNGPAGSAAGTALGMDTVREFRVESTNYNAEYGRNIGARSTPSPSRAATGFPAAPSNITATTRSTPETTSIPRRSLTSSAISSAARSAGRFVAIACSSLPATRGSSRTSAGPSSPACPTTRRGPACCRPGR